MDIKTAVIVINSLVSNIINKIPFTLQTIGVTKKLQVGKTLSKEIGLCIKCSKNSNSI
jgi:hypothetical protein